MCDLPGNGHAGVDLPAGFVPDGQSAVPAFKGEGFSRTKPIFWQWRGGISKDYTWPTLGIRDGRWKLLVNQELGMTELYNLEQDWAEQTDVSGKHPEVAEELNRRLVAWKQSLPAAPDSRCCAESRSPKPEKTENKK